jgi:hypothetical protein
MDFRQTCAQSVGPQPDFSSLLENHGDCAPPTREMLIHVTHMERNGRLDRVP